MLQSLLTGVTAVGIFFHQVDDKVFSYNYRKKKTDHKMYLSLNSFFPVWFEGLRGCGRYKLAVVAEKR